MREHENPHVAQRAWYAVQLAASLMATCWAVHMSLSL